MLFSFRRFLLSGFRVGIIQEEKHENPKDENSKKAEKESRESTWNAQ